MTRLLVHVEGQTEEAFVNEVLSPHLYQNGWQSVSARLLGVHRARGQRGGITPWGSALRDITRHLRADAGCCSTTLVDYYALPRDWPGREEANTLPFGRKAPHVQQQLQAAIEGEMGHPPCLTRFVPFVVMHEFEALLFSQCQTFSEGMGREDLHKPLQRIRDGFASPEEINDSPATAPSRRILQLFPGYQKPLHGNLAALQIGLAQIRRECPHFAAWLTGLERIPTLTSNEG